MFDSVYADLYHYRDTGDILNFYGRKGVLTEHLGTLAKPYGRLWYNGFVSGEWVEKVIITDILRKSFSWVECPYHHVRYVRDMNTRQVHYWECKPEFEHVHIQ